jgi:hypothetical protein
MARCFNKNTAEYKALLDQYNNTVLVDNLIDSWQQSRNTELLPTLFDVKEFLDQRKIAFNLKKENFENAIYNSLKQKGLVSVFNDRYYVQQSPENYMEAGVDKRILEANKIAITNFFVNWNIPLDTLTFKKTKNSYEVIIDRNIFTPEDIITEDTSKNYTHTLQILDHLSKLFPNFSYDIVSATEAKEYFKKLYPKENININDINSYYFNGKSKIIKGRATPEIAAEEMLHPFIDAIKISNPNLYKGLLKESIKNFPALQQQIISMYSLQKGFTEEDQNIELVTQALARHFKKEYEGEPSSSWFNKISQLLKFLGDVIHKMYEALTGTPLKLNINDIKSTSTLTDLAKLLNTRNLEFTFKPVEDVPVRTIRYSLTDRRQRLYNHLLGKASTPMQQEVLKMLFGIPVKSKKEYEFFTASPATDELTGTRRPVVIHNQENHTYHKVDEPNIMYTGMTTAVGGIPSKVKAINKADTLESIMKDTGATLDELRILNENDNANWELLLNKKGTGRASSIYVPQENYKYQMQLGDDFDKILEFILLDIDSKSALDFKNLTDFKLMLENELGSLNILNEEQSVKIYKQLKSVVAQLEGSDDYAEGSTDTSNQTILVPQVVIGNTDSANRLAGQVDILRIRPDGSLDKGDLKTSKDSVNERVRDRKLLSQGIKYKIDVPYPVNPGSIFFDNSKSLAKQKKLSKRVRQALQVYGYGNIMQNNGYDVNVDDMSKFTVNFWIQYDKKGQYQDFIYEGIRTQKVDQDLLQEVVPTIVDNLSQQALEDLKEKHGENAAEIDDFVEQEDAEGEDVFQDLNSIVLLKGLEKYSARILSKAEMMKKFQDRNKLLKSNKEVLDHIDEVATLIASLSMDTDKTVLSVADEVLSMAIQELEEWENYIEDESNIDEGGLEYIGRLMNMKKYTETYQHLHQIFKDTEKLPDYIEQKLRTLTNILNRINGLRIGNEVVEEGLVTKYLLIFAERYIGEGGKGASKRNFSKEELEEVTTWAEDIGLGEFVSGDLNTSKDTLLALMAKEYKKAKMKSLDEYQAIMEENNMMTDELYKAAKRAGQNPDKRGWWKWMWQLDEEGNPTMQSVQKRSKSYWEKRKKVKEVLIDPVTGQPMQYIGVGRNVEDLTEEEIEWNKKVASLRREKNNFMRPERTDENGELVEGDYHKYTDEFIKERNKYLEPITRWSETSGEYYTVWYPRDNVSRTELDRFYIKYYNHQGYDRAVLDGDGMPTGEVIREEVGSPFVKFEYVEATDRGGRKKDENMIDEKWQNIMDADPADELAMAKKNYFEFFQAKKEMLLTKLPSETRQKFSGGRMPIMRDNYANQVLNQPNPMGYLWSELKNIPMIGPIPNPWSSFWKPTHANRVILHDEGGNPLDTLPVYYTGNIKNDKAIETLYKRRDEVIKKIKEKKITKKQGKEELENIDIAIQKNEQLPTSTEINTNAADILNNFAGMAVHYDAMIEIEDLLKAILKVVEKREYEPSRGERLYKWVGGKFKRSGVKGDDPESRTTPLIVQRAHKWMRMVYYNNDRMSTNWANKIARTIMDVSSMTYVGFNPWGNINNYAVGRMQNIIETGGALYYCRKCAINATLVFNQNAYTDFLKRLSHSGAVGLGIKTKYSAQHPYTKFGGAVEHFRMLDALADIREVSGEGAGVTLKDYVRDKLSWGYFLQDAGEFNVQTKVGIAILMSHKMRRGPKENNDVISLWDALEWNHRTGKMTMKEGYTTFIEYGTGREEEYTDQTRYEIRNYIREVNKQIHGNYAHDDRMVMQSTALGELAAQFHKWVAPAFKARWRPEYFDENLGWIEGRYMTLWTFMAHFLWAKQYSEGRIQNVKEFLGDPEKGRMRQANLMKFATDATVIAASLVTAMMLNSMWDDEDEDKSTVRKRFENAMIYQFRRQAVELQMFMPVLGMQELWMMSKSPIAASRYLGEWGEVLDKGFFTPIAWLTMDKDDFYADKRYVYQTGTQKGKVKFWKEWRDVTPILYAINRFKMYDNMKDFFVK